MLISQEDYQNQLLKITRLNCSKTSKIVLLSALLQELRSKITTNGGDQDKNSKTMFTQDTINSDNPVDVPQQISELEKKIILKRDIKIQLNQQIQDAQEELQSIEKAVFVKRQLDDDLKRKIDNTMFEIEVGSYQQRQKELAREKEKEKQKNKNKTFSTFSRKVFDFFS